MARRWRATWSSMRRAGEPMCADGLPRAPYGLFMVAPSDRRTFCVMIGNSHEDPLRKSIFDPAVFDRVAAGEPFCAPWLRAGVGTTAPQPFANVHNGRRSLVDGEGPIVTGFVLVGDS